MKPVIVWFRNDLRISDHPALWTARETGRPVIPLFILSDEGEETWKIGGASRWWLHHALQQFEKELEAIATVKPQNGALLLCHGPIDEALLEVARAFGSNEIFVSQALEPLAESQDKRLHQALGREGIELRRFHGNLLLNQSQIKKDDGSSYQVFTPFYKSALKLPVKEPLPELKSLNLDPSLGEKKLAKRRSLDSLGLLKGLGWSKKFANFWLKKPFWFATEEVLERALEVVPGYGQSRDFPALAGSSRLSPLLHFGQVSPRQVYARIQKLPETDHTRGFIRQIYWREFAHDQLFVHPTMDHIAIRREFRDFPYELDKTLLQSWQVGQTGYPIVDAAMRELWETGFMHNRCRMIVGSFLVKDLLCPWQAGAEWFWDTLVDADLANNSMGWQWIAGCGVDAAPYFRIFNPLLQSQKFDPHGSYIKKYLPELGKLTPEDVHAPWAADPYRLKQANVILGKNYPHPIVDHKKATFRALKAYDAIKQKKD